MKHTLSEQYKVTQEMRRVIKILIENGLIGTDNANRVDSVLNDIGSTLAALNLTKDLVDKGREEYMTKLENLTADWLEYWEETKRDEILSMSYDEIAKAHARIRELEEALRDAKYFIDESRPYIQKANESAFPDENKNLWLSQLCDQNSEEIKSLLKQD